MPVWLPWRRQDITEAAPTTVLAQSVPARTGYVPDVPLGGSTKYQPGGDYPTDRVSFMQQVYGAYLGCPWASAAVDTVARTVTAGGLRLVNDNDDDHHRLTPEKRPPNVQKLQALFDRCNPHEDIRQLMRGVVTDIQVFGDAFVEVTWLGGQPVALYSLDAPSMIVNADVHGTVTGFTQQLGPERIVDFEPHEVLHISTDSPRGSLYGLGVIQRALLPITVWLFTAALMKEAMRKGDPPSVVFDFGPELTEDAIKRWRQQYQVRNLGAANIGTPVTTQGLAGIHELKVNRLAEYIAILNQKRDEIIASCGVPPRKLGIAEAGQLGGTGEGSTQDKTFRVNTCGPLAELVLEKFQYHLAEHAFGVTDWRVEFGDVDWRDDQVVETIRDQRLRNGSWSLNRYRFEIGEPEVDGGDEAVLVDRQNLLLWADMAAYSKAFVASTNPAVPGDVAPAPAGVDVLPKTAGAAPAVPAKAAVPVAAKAAPGKPGEPAAAPKPVETDDTARLEESWQRAFKHMRREALRTLPTLEEDVHPEPWPPSPDDIEAPTQPANPGLTAADAAPLIDKDIA